MSLIGGQAIGNVVGMIKRLICTAQDSLASFIQREAKLLRYLQPAAIDAIRAMDPQTFQLVSIAHKIKEGSKILP
jgi:hypothetical protein